MSVKLFLAEDSIIFSPHYNYDPRTTVIALRQEGPSIRAAFIKEEMRLSGKTPKVNTVVEEATVVETAPVSQPVVEAVPAVPTVPAAPTTPPPKRKLVLKLKDTAPPTERRKPKLVLKNQPSQ